MSPTSAPSAIPPSDGDERLISAMTATPGPAQNAAVILTVFDGERGPRRDAVILNAAAALLVGGVVADWEAGIVGVNARDLESLEVDRDRQLELLATLPPTVTRVAESGIASRADVEAAHAAGADAVLVGTSLMRRPELLAELVGVPR